MSPAVRLVRGLAGLLGIVAVLAGVPAVLLAVGAVPSVPGGTLDGAFLLSPDDGTLVLVVAVCAAWGAWGVLSLSVLVEIASRLRGVKAPRMPGLGVPQRMAAALVTAAALLIAGPLGAQAATMQGSAAAPHTSVSASVQVSGGAVLTGGTSTATTTDGSTASPDTDADADAAATEGPAARPTVRYEVRRGDSLWSIAQRTLGEGRRYHEIVALNRDVLGDDPGFITPGVVLDLPAEAGTEDGTGAGGADHGTTYTVHRGDTLSGIAQEQLGDADRYREIVRASRDVDQPHGRHLTDADEIRPGWTLVIPDDRAGTAGDDGGADSSTSDSSTTDGSATDEGAGPAADPQDAPGADGRSAEEGDAADDGSTTVQEPEESGDEDVAGPVDPTAGASSATAPGGTTTSGGTTAPGGSTSTGTATDAQGRTAGPLDQVVDALGDLADDPWVTRTGYGAGALLAAGVVALLARRRRAQQRARRPGERVPVPEGPVLEVENELRAVADALSVDVVDAALRALAEHCIERETPLPEVRTAHLGAERFTVHLAEPAELPVPWRGSADLMQWHLMVDDARLDDLPVLEDVAAPYPALVTIGQDEDGHVLADLEHLGTLAVRGPDERVGEVLAALAIELATSTWADDAQVMVVGAFGELEDSLRTGRITYVPTVGGLIDQLRSRASQDRAALADGGATDLHEARVTGTAPDTWTPTVVLLAGPVTAAQRAVIDTLVQEEPRTAVAVVAPATDVDCPWTLDLDPLDPDRAVLDPLGLELHPQRLPAEQYGRILDLAAMADEADLVPAELPAADEPTLDDLPTVVVDDEPDFHPGELVEADDDATAEEALVQPLPLPAPRILVIGPVEMADAGGTVEPSKRRRLLEYAAYLALNPGVGHTAIDDAIWPHRAKEDNLSTRNPATSRLRRWLGVTADGRDYLPRHQAGGGYALLPEVGTDVSEWDALVGGRPLQASTENLERALRLVRGRPFEGHHRRYYGWAEPLVQRLTSEIVDASYELTRRRLMEGRWRAAEESVVVGLRIEPAHEALWRLRIMAAHESRNQVALAEAVERLLTVTEQLECDLEPETEVLLAAVKTPGTGIGRLLGGL